MAPVKKFAITITSLTALALVMSACAGNLEAKKLGVGNTGVLGKANPAAQSLMATDDGTATFDENCAASEELQTKTDGETEVSVADLIDGKSNKYVLERNEFIKATLDKTVSPSTSKVIAAKGQGESIAIVCHNSKAQSSADFFAFANPIEFDSNDGSSTQSREIQVLTENGKIGAQTMIIESVNNLAKLEEIKKQGGELSVTKDATGTIRIRYSMSEEKEKTFFHASQLLVYKVMTAEQAEAAKADEQEAKPDDNAAQAAADAVANEAGIPTESEAQASPDMEEAQRKLNERMRQQSEELARKQQAQIQADMDRRADETLAKAEERLRPKLPPCTVSSVDAPCPNESRQAQMALAAAQYRAQQEFAAKMAGATTTTSTTRPTGSARAADAIDHTAPGQYPR